MGTIVSPTPAVNRPEKATSFWHGVKKPLRILSFFFLALVVLAIATAAIFEKQIGDKLIGLLGESLETELTVEDFDFSLIRHPH